MFFRFAFCRLQLSLVLTDRTSNICLETCQDREREGSLTLEEAVKTFSLTVAWVMFYILRKGLSLLEMNGPKALVLKERAWTPERLGANVSGASPRLPTSLNGSCFCSRSGEELARIRVACLNPFPLHPCCFCAPHGRTRVLRGHMCHLGVRLLPTGVLSWRCAAVSFANIFSVCGPSSPSLDS